MRRRVPACLTILKQAGKKEKIVMAKEVLLPKQGNTVESCIINEWLKKEGEKVSTGEPICAVETDKATFEIEAPSEGILLKQFFEEGDDVPVLTVIAAVGEEGENVDALAPDKEAIAKAAGAGLVPEAEPAGAAPQSPVQSVGQAVEAVEGAGISPRARILAGRRGIDMTGIAGSGPGGRIIERDVKAALRGEAMPKTRPGESPSSALPFADLEPVGPGREIPFKGIRKLIGSRMYESLQYTAQLTLNSSANVSALLKARKQLKASPEESGLKNITITDLLAYILARTLPEYPYLNAHHLGERIFEYDDVNLGLAVDTEKGLMVPPIRSANKISLTEISSEAKRITNACREGRIMPDELNGGTFTVTNLGMLGIESFTPILNAPEVGILGVCAVQSRPVVSKETGEVAFAPHMGLSLTFNHQAVDGAPAARFLQGLCVAIEQFNLEKVLNSEG